MYCAALKFCGGMELCGLGFPKGEPMGSRWNECLDQIRAQNAAIVIAYSREHAPEERQWLTQQQFVEGLTFRNPRTNSVITMWVWYA